MSKKTPKFEPVLISSRDGMHAVVTQIVNDKLSLAGLKVEMEKEIAAIAEKYQGKIDALNRSVLMNEGGLQVWAERNPDQFGEKKSIDLPLARFGFRLSPHKVEKAKGVRNWDDVASRLISTLITEDGTDNSPFIFEGEDYVRYSEATVDKAKLLANRKNIPADALKAAGIFFEQEENFFFEPKSEVLEASSQEAA